MEAWISLLADFGFPVAVTFYLLHRVEGKLNQLIESIYSISFPKKID
ncbi:YvrJ family protein [Oceanobacillus jeddahense]|uniref:YvrJ family protein n=1 Tax=Oceanobacillus jeddahense TaxID=1462527 RepID=A0ABY5JP95_9BACI|nr:YvrJ family protein [Oceanobacillus jeddahense]UUI02117.1 YvrJ family protein [Oceanobacillus jeddahense]